jgi:hypothetical protein
MIFSNKFNLFWTITLFSYYEHSQIMAVKVLKYEAQLEKCLLYHSLYWAPLVTKCSWLSFIFFSKKNFKNISLQEFLLLLLNSEKKFAKRNCFKLLAFSLIISFYLCPFLCLRLFSMFICLPLCSSSSFIFICVSISIFVCMSLYICFSLSSFLYVSHFIFLPFSHFIPVFLCLYLSMFFHALSSSLSVYVYISSYLFSIFISTSPLVFLFLLFM